MKNQILIFGMLFALAATIPSCKPEEGHDHSHETITSLRVTLRDSSNTSVLGSWSFSDRDGDGGNAPVADTIRLNAGTRYRAELQLLDESGSPAKDLSGEIREAGDEHLFVFTAAGISIQTEILDRDSRNLPLGFESSWQSGAAGNGVMIILLKHQPGVKDGTAIPGDTDLEARFPVLIQ